MINASAYTHILLAIVCISASVSSTMLPSVKAKRLSVAVLRTRAYANENHKTLRYFRNYFIVDCQMSTSSMVNNLN